jgi:hypothetical protein
VVFIRGGVAALEEGRDGQAGGGVPERRNHSLKIETCLFDVRGHGFEFKYGDAPAMTKSMYIALQDLKLHRLCVIYPGKESYALERRVEVVAIQDRAGKLATLC